MSVYNLKCMDRDEHQYQHQHRNKQLSRATNYISRGVAGTYNRLTWHPRNGGGGFDRCGSGSGGRRRRQGRRTHTGISPGLIANSAGAALGGSSTACSLVIRDTCLADRRCAHRIIWDGVDTFAYRVTCATKLIRARVRSYRLHFFGAAVVGTFLRRNVVPRRGANETVFAAKPIARPTIVPDIYQGSTMRTHLSVIAYPCAGLGAVIAVGASVVVHQVATGHILDHAPMTNASPAAITRASGGGS